MTASVAVQQIVRNMITSFKGKVFYVEFLKKDGTLRKMVARTGVTKGVKGSGKTLDTNKHTNLITVCDMVLAAKEGVDKSYRVISLDKISYLACGNDTFGEKDKGE